MLAKAKSNSLITHVVEGTQIVFNVRDVGEMALDVAKLSKEVLQRATIHGLIQRISDAAAISRDPETGLAATAETKFSAMEKLVAHYMTGTDQWSRQRSAGEASEGILFQALIKMYPEKSAEQIRAYLATKDRSAKIKLRRVPKVAAIITALQAAQDDGTGDKLLDELETIE